MTSSHPEVMVSLVSLLLLDDQDFLFHLATQVNLTLFMHIANYQILKVLISNAFNQTICISRRHKHGHLIDIVYDNCFPVNTISTLDAAIFSFLL